MLPREESVNWQKTLPKITEKNKILMGWPHPSGLKFKRALRTRVQRGGGGHQRRWSGRVQGGALCRWVVVVVTGEHQNNGEVDSGGRRRRVVVRINGEGSGCQIEARKRSHGGSVGYWQIFGGGGVVVVSC